MDPDDDIAKEIAQKEHRMWRGGRKGEMKKRVHSPSELVWIYIKALFSSCFICLSCFILLSLFLGFINHEPGAEYSFLGIVTPAVIIGVITLLPASIYALIVTLYVDMKVSQGIALNYKQMMFIYFLFTPILIIFLTIGCGYLSRCYV